MNEDKLLPTISFYLDKVSENNRALVPYIFEKLLLNPKINIFNIESEMNNVIEVLNLMDEAISLKEKRDKDKWKNVY
jgi:hypothetical protein